MVSRCFGRKEFTERNVLWCSLLWRKTARRKTLLSQNSNTSLYSLWLCFVQDDGGKNLQVDVEFRTRQNMTGCYHHQARLTETASLDFKHMNHCDVISVQSNLVSSCAWKKTRAGNEIAGNQTNIVYNIFIESILESVQLRKIHQAIRQWLSTADCIFTLKPRFIYFLLGSLKNLFWQNLYWLSTREYKIRETALVTNNSSYFWIHARGEILLTNRHFTRNKKIVFPRRFLSQRCTLFVYRWFHPLVSLFSSVLKILNANWILTVIKRRVGNSFS